MAKFDASADPQFTQPVNQIIIMFLICILAGVGVFFAYPAVSPIFLASPYLNGFIILVFLFGIMACFWQVLTLINSVSWIEGFALDRAGHEFVRAPGLLASLAALLRKKGARSQITSFSSTSILDSVATRLDEARDLTRYIINLLIFLGLLGTFYGLAISVPAVVDTIRSLAPQGDDSSSIDIFDNLMSGLEEQLGGMGTAFGSSLLGLAGSLIVGLLELFAAKGQNRFYGELEVWLSSITQLGVSASDETQGASSGFTGYAEYSAMQFDKLQDILAELRDRSVESERQTASLTKALQQMADYSVAAQEGSKKAVEAVAESQRQIVDVIKESQALTPSGAESSGEHDLEINRRLANIETQMLRMLEEIAMGRNESTQQLRTDLHQLTQVIRDAAAGSNPTGEY
jgi:hypothetical protein